MAATRDKRSNAGSKMSTLLEAEEEDDFYKTTYGGFNEEEDDKVYESEVSESDYEDSDISIDEDDEVKSDDDAAPKKKKRVVTKAYKEPAAKKPKPDVEKKVKEKKPPKPAPSIQIYHSPEKKTLRKSTADRSKQIAEREKERDSRTKMLKDIALQKRVAEVRRLTQEELLEEAKVTEELNLMSLENYKRLELEKKNRRIQKAVYRGPVIRYHSLTMPVIEELPDNEINIDQDSSEDTVKASNTEKMDSSEKCSRTFITFTDERNIKEYFSSKRTRPPVKQFCPVTRLPAKYFDPITNTPYATLQAFKIIREAYAQQLQSEGSKRSRSATPDTSQMEVSVTS